PPAELARRSPPGPDRSWFLDRSQAGAKAWRGPGAARTTPASRASRAPPSPRSDRNVKQRLASNVLAYAIRLDDNVLVIASISNYRKEIAMIQEVEVDPDESLTRRWGTRA